MKRQTKSEAFLIPGILPHVIADKQGKKLGVFLEMQDYQRLVEHVEDFLLGAVASAVKSKQEKTTSIAAIEKKLKKASGKKR